VPVDIAAEVRELAGQRHGVGFDRIGAVRIPAKRLIESVAEG
jgi:hypothetical protein